MGTSSGVTDSGGVNRFPSLPPGTYAVRVELQGFRPLVRENVAVLTGQTTPIDVTLTVATVAETVTVTGSSPVVDTTSANVSVNLSEQLLQGTPGGRDIWSLVEYKVPSLLITRPDVGGTSGGLQGVYNARGTPSSQNSQFLNGINVGIGAAGFYYDFDAFDDIQVSTGAHDITVPTSGAFLNMVTKGGTDQWRGRSTFTWLGDATQWQNIDDALLHYGFRPNTNEVDFVSDVNVSGDGRHGAVRAGQLLPEAPDADRGRAVGAPRGLPARAEQPTQPVLPGARPDLPRAARHPALPHGRPTPQRRLRSRR